MIMQNKDLIKEFLALVQAGTKDNMYNVIPVPSSDHKLGVSKEGYPMFFICTNDEYSTTSNIGLNILSVEYNLSCTFVDESDNKTLNNYSVITLRSTDKVLQETFFDVMFLMLERLGNNPSKTDIATEVESLISIFSAMNCPPRKKIQGLWAELLVIERSKNPEFLINAWHQNPTAKYDFAVGSEKVEVKSTSKETREHHFSLDQLSPSNHSRVVIASTIVRETSKGTDGLSIHDLYDKICKTVTSSDAKLHLMKVISETLGNDIRHIYDIYFDYTESSDTLRYYDSQDIPKVYKDNIDPGVSGVGFNSNLSGVMDIQSPSSNFDRKDSPLFLCLF